MDRKELRARFAAAAIQGVTCTGYEKWDKDPKTREDFANLCWRLADAMMVTLPKEVLSDEPDA